MIDPQPAVLEGYGIRLEPLTEDHCEALAAAAGDGRLWELWFTAIPTPENMQAYVSDALKGQREGHMLPWAVRDEDSGAIIGSTRYHDIVARIDRVEIGYTWYAQSRQRTNVNTTCKLLLLSHAFETLGCRVVGLRTDNFNLRSQRAIEALGAKKDGVLRHYAARPDGTARDQVMYSILAGEWTDVRRHLELRLHRHTQAAQRKSRSAAGEVAVTRRRLPNPGNRCSPALFVLLCVHDQCRPSGSERKKSPPGGRLAGLGGRVLSVRFIDKAG